MGGIGLLSGGGAGSAGDKLTGGSKAANKASKANLAQIKALFEQLNAYGSEQYGNAMKSIEGIGAASKNDALSREKQYVAGSTQNLANMGLSGSTAANAAQRGIHSDTLRTLGGINEDIARMKASLFTGQAGFRQGNVNSLSGLLGNYQNAPGTNYLAEAMKLAPLFMSDIRRKNIIRQVRTAVWNGIEFGVYRFTYKDNPDAEFEGVIAQDVRYIPGVVTRDADGWLMVNVEALKRKTGVEVKRVGAEVSV